MMQEKSDLMKRCQELVEELKEQDREVATDVRGVYRDIDALIEGEKKAFRANYEDRLNKVKTVF
jgi:DNA-binding ferritin-like protein (Dps family)